MTSAGIDFHDDSFVFEPTAWDFAVDIGIRVDPIADSSALDELADAMLVSMEDRPELERLTDNALDRIWTDELSTWIRDGIVELARRDNWRDGAQATLMEFDSGPRAAEVSREVVRHLAMQLSQYRTAPFFCLDCLEEAVVRAPPHEQRSVAIGAAVAACRNVQVRDEELRAGVRNPEAAAGLGTPERRRAVRLQLGRIAELSASSFPHLSDQLRAIASEPVPPSPAEDDAWKVVAEILLRAAAQPDAN